MSYAFAEALDDRGENRPGYSWTTGPIA